jgi:hypothetical protein
MDAGQISPPRFRTFRLKQGVSHGGHGAHGGEECPDVTPRVTHSPCSSCSPCEPRREIGDPLHHGSRSAHCRGDRREAIFRRSAFRRFCTYDRAQFEATINSLDQTTKRSRNRLHLSRRKGSEGGFLRVSQLRGGIGQSTAGRHAANAALFMANEKHGHPRCQ